MGEQNQEMNAVLRQGFNKAPAKAEEKKVEPEKRVEDEGE